MYRTRDSGTTTQKYGYCVSKRAYAVTRTEKERRSTQFQPQNDLFFVMQQGTCADLQLAPEIYFVSDGGWDHAPTNSEVRLCLTLDHVRHQRHFTAAVVRVLGLSSSNEAERVNGMETRSVQRATLREHVVQEEPGEDLLDTLQPGHVYKELLPKGGGGLGGSVGLGVWVKSLGPPPLL